MLKIITLMCALCLCFSFFCITCGGEDEPQIALTFDDGPHPVYTPQILDILKANGIKATFFIIGENAENHPEIVRRIIAEGHEIGNHTYSHPHLKKIGDEELTHELKKTETLLREKFHYTPTLFRPPEGYCCAAVQQSSDRMGYALTLWDVDTTDWAHNPSENIIKTVLATVKEGSIILCHDYVTKPSPTPDAIKVLIPKLKAKGYEFVTVSELIKTDP